MKLQFFTFAAILGLGFSAMAQYQIDLNITSLNNNNGYVLVELLDESNKEIGQYKLEISNRECHTNIKDLKAGTYAIRYFHDVNNNGALDTGTFGIPKEGYGFSKNARGFMGPPDFEDYIFNLKENTKMTLITVN